MAQRRALRQPRRLPVLTYAQDPLKVCAIKNLCWDAVRQRALLVAFGDETAVTAMQAALSACRKSTTFQWCRCIMSDTRIAITTYASGGG